MSNAISGEIRQPPSVNGDGNEIQVDPGVQFNVLIHIIGNNNRIIVGAGVNVANGAISIINVSGAEVRIGANTTITLARFHVHEKASIILGEDCMISNEVFVSVSDMHPIYDRSTRERINPARDVIIGDHVWLGVGSRIIKGSVGSGSIIGAGAIVTSVIPENVLASGVPAKVLREDVYWERPFRKDA